MFSEDDARNTAARADISQILTNDAQPLMIWKSSVLCGETHAVVSINGVLTEGVLLFH